MTPTSEQHNLVFDRGGKLFLCGWMESVIYFKSAFVSDQIIISFSLTFTEHLTDTSWE